MDSFLRACESAWPANTPRPRVIARAPGRLDCIGGMADYSGSLALQLTTECAVLVAAGPREDQRIHIESLGWNGDPARVDWPLSVFYQSDGQFVTPGELARQFERTPWVRHAAGVCLALLESGEIPHFAGGATLVIQSNIPPGAGLASSAALQIAVAQALAGLFDVELEPAQIVRACRVADAEVAKSRLGLVDHLCCLHGEPDALLQIRSMPDEVLGTVTLPRDVTIAAVDSDVATPIRQQRYIENRTAALMGHHMVREILRRMGREGESGSACLAGVTPTEYVEYFRNELPVKLRGREFLERWPDADLDAVIEPDAIYKVRSRTEHHIYENDRAHRFMERLNRVRRTGERDALVEAGELMYASHWSYSQRCGMGSIETDILVNEIRQRGPARGLYGAKVTGRGCGGSIAVLMSTHAGARAALEEACEAYAARSGRKPTILTGSSPGALAFGRRYLD